MQLPIDIVEKLNSLYDSLENKNLKQTRENLTYKYKNSTGQSKNLVSSKKESIVYAISRMPATYSVLYTLINDLLEQNLISNINTIFDVGSGTGSGYFAFKNFFENASFSLFERNQDMIDVFNFISSDEKDIVGKFDILVDDFKSSADLVLTSYMLSELNQKDRVEAFKKLLNSSNKYLLIVDTGTPETYKNFMELKKLAGELGYYTIAPCLCENCTLNNDYCQFYARVTRSSLMRISKSGTLPYEDEKYFYLLFSRENFKMVGERIIRRPRIFTNEIELIACGEDGYRNIKVTKKNRDEFKRAKKIKINQIF